MSKRHALTSLYKRREEATRWTNNKLMTMTTWESFKVSTLFDYNLFTHTFDVRDSLISNQCALREKICILGIFFSLPKWWQIFVRLNSFYFKRWCTKPVCCFVKLSEAFAFIKKVLDFPVFVQLLFLLATLWKDLNNGERRWIDGILMMCDVIKMRI